MSELSMGQRDTIRIAYRAAEKSGDDTVIQGRVRQLAKDFKISEGEVLSIAKGLKAAPLFSLKNEQKSIPSPKTSGKRLEWTTEMLTQLTALHAQSLGPTAIAGQMGLEPNQVQQKLYLLRKQGALHEPDAIKEPGPPSPALAAESVVPKQESKTAAPDPIAVPIPAIKIPEIKAPDSIGKQLRQAVESEKSAFSTLPGPVGVPDDEGEDPEALIDMPAALLFLMKLVHEHYGDNVIRVHASNDEHYAACAFAAEGIEYNLKPEVLGE